MIVAMLTRDLWRKLFVENDDVIAVVSSGPRTSGGRAPPSL